MINQGILIPRPLMHPVVSFPRHLEMLTKDIQEMIFKFLRFHEVSGLLIMSRTLTNKFPDWIYSNMRFNRPWQVHFDLFYANLEHIYLYWDRPPYNYQQLAYRFQYRSVYWNGGLNVSDIDQAEHYQEFEVPEVAYEQTKIVECILKLNRCKINKALLSDIPLTSHRAFFAILHALTQNQVNDEIDFKRFQDIKSIFSNEDELAKICHDNIVVAYHVMNDPWMRQRLPYLERNAPNIFRFSVFGSNEDLYRTSIGVLTVIAILVFIVGATLAPMITLPALVTILIILGATFLPFLFLPLLYTLMKFLTQLVTGVASTVKRKVDLYEAILTQQNDIPTDTFLALEKTKIEAFLTQKRSNLATQRRGLFTLFYRNNAEKIQNVNKALTALQQVCSIEELVTYKVQHLSEQDLMDLHFEIPTMFNAVSVNAMR